MVFSSAVFLFAFLPAVLLLYFLPLCFWNRRLEDHRKNLVLCAASLIFYAWGEPVYIILMLLSIGFNFNIGLDIERCADDSKYSRIFVVIYYSRRVGSDSLSVLPHRWPHPQRWEEYHRYLSQKKLPLARCRYQSHMPSLSEFYVHHCCHSGHKETKLPMHQTYRHTDRE